MPGPTLNARTLELLEASPCDDCRFRKRCSSERLACAAFSMLVHGEPPPRWRNAPRSPTRSFYVALFSEVTRTAA